jgi:hypothetical protein
MPEAAPRAPAPPLDLSLINQYQGFAGPAPTPPVIQQPGTLDKIAAVLSGIALGPQYGQQLKAERERPIREYEQQRQQYEQRKGELGLLGRQTAERKAERDQAATQKVADEQADRDFKTWLRAANITDEQAIQQARQAFEIQKIREQERVADERQAALEQKQLKLKAADLAKAYRLAGGGQYANELAERDLGLRPSVSKAADKWLSSHVQLEQARANKLAGVGGGGGSASGGKLMAQLENGQVIPVSLVDKAKGMVVLDGKPVKVVGYVGGGATGAQPQANQTGPAMAQPPDETVNKYAQRFKLSVEQARRELMMQP